MKKLLKIQFWKAEKTLAMQVLEQEGLPKCKDYGFVRINNFPWFYKDHIELRGRKSSMDWNLHDRCFDDNEERDDYLQRIVSAITDELFTGEGELKIGEICEVWDSLKSTWLKRKLIAILPEDYKYRFIAEHGENPTQYCDWEYARSIPEQIKPTIEECGNVVTCTWEE